MGSTPPRVAARGIIMRQELAGSKPGKGKKKAHGHKPVGLVSFSGIFSLGKKEGLAGLFAR
jgi:hypothetical protein